MNYAHNYQFLIPSELNYLDDGVPLHAIDVWHSSSNANWVIQYRFDDETMYETTKPTFQEAMVLVAQMLAIGMEHTLEEEALIVHSNEVVEEFNALAADTRGRAA